jgi:hypothetical protein
VSTRIPAFLSFHIEPDAYQLGPSGPATWDGYDVLTDLVTRLRPLLGEKSGSSPRFSWMFRMDPQVAATSPRADHAVTGFGDRIERLAAEEDAFGIHVHPLRWVESRHVWVHDIADDAFTQECVERSVDVFKEAFGEPPRRHSFGASLLLDHVIATLERAGVWLDFTADRRYRERVYLEKPRDAATGVDTSPVVGRMKDGTRIPPRPYRPMHNDSSRPDDVNGRQLVIVPQSSAPSRPERPAWRRGASWVRYGMRTPIVTMYPAKAWPSPQYYWDLVERQLGSMPRPYVAIAARVEAPDCEIWGRTRSILEHLPSHPIAERLEFVDPVAAVPALLSDPARSTLAWCA